MPDQIAPVITAAVEGNLDEAVIRRLIEDAGCVVGLVYGRRGKNYLRDKLKAFNHAALFRPWVVLVDLDRDADCAPRLRQEWLERPSTGMLFRVAVREVESWLLGDRDRLANFLHVNSDRISANPEDLPNVKRTMVDLARRSRRREIVEDIVPDPTAGRIVGRAYSSRLSEFVLDRAAGWRPNVAAQVCPSLWRFINRLKNFPESLRP